MPNPDPQQATRLWLRRLVIGMNLCPFAGAAEASGAVRLVVAGEPDAESCLQLLANEAAALIGRSRSRPAATTLLILPTGFADFDDYLDLLAIGEDLLIDLGYEGELQLASFHPDYQFEGTDPDDVTNWTNRAPYPVLHLLTESSVAHAVERHPDPAGIPARNREQLAALGIASMRRALEG